MKIRVGFGFDVHALAVRRKMILGGVEIPHGKGCLGHSDGDVLLHAICDALLGAAGLNDIGHHFPDTDIRFKDADSKMLLKECIKMVREKGYTLGNVDCTLCAELPKISPHISAMKKVISEILCIDPEDISIKATTMEKLGYVGSQKGIHAYSVVLIQK